MNLVYFQGTLCILSVLWKKLFFCSVICLSVTEELVRQRAEHNNCELFSLEEVSLHQQNIEKIEHLDKWCRNLKILYLQNNLISKIENVSRLKKLVYLNLALNNIEKFENLEGCEDLQKLDLTANFIGELSSVKILKNNIHLEELFLIGNPCTDFEGYRQFVVATLQQLRFLDCKEITRSERIQALQHYPELERKIYQQEQTYRLKREEEKKEAERRMLEKQKERKEKKKRQHVGFEQQSHTDIKTPIYYSVEGAENHHNCEGDGEFRNLILEDDDEDREFWDEPVPHTPEARLEIHQYLEEKRKEKENRYISWVFFFLKAFQLVLPEEVKPDSSIAKRSQTTGHLVINMPKVGQTFNSDIKITTAPSSNLQSQHEGLEKLEIDPTKYSFPDVTTIVHKKDQVGQGPLRLQQPKAENAENLSFEDNPEVPPLI
uniref:Leucine-rich repeat-containing protein 6 n=1 Tax=Pseudonaja textilis TaxID=8673 RepID=A0A670YHZ0_PSETE